MLNLTKSVTVTWISEEAQLLDGLDEERTQKLEDMFDQVKTDSLPYFILKNKTRRYFIDQAAAEEWKEFILSMDAKYGPNLVTSIDIVDK